MQKKITVRVHEIWTWVEDLTMDESRMVGLFFINKGYDDSVIEHYLDGNECTKNVGEFKQVGSPNVLNNIPPIFRIEID